MQSSDTKQPAMDVEKEILGLTQKVDALKNLAAAQAQLIFQLVDQVKQQDEIIRSIPPLVSTSVAEVLGPFFKGMLAGMSQREKEQVLNRFLRDELRKSDGPSRS